MVLYKLLIIFFVILIIFFDMILIFQKKSNSMFHDVYLKKINIRIIIFISLSYYLFLKSFDISDNIFDKVFMRISPLFAIIIAFIYIGIYISTLKKSKLYPRD